MESVRVVCVLLLACVSACSGRAYTFGSAMHFVGPDPIERTPTCRYDSKPCMILVREYNRNGTVSGEFRTRGMCRCSDDECPTTWDGDEARTITRYLRTQDNVMELQLKFCRRVQTERVCGPHEVALTLKGHTLVPQEVTSVNCRCNRDSPLHLQKFWYEASNPYIRNQNFVCDMAECGGNDNVPCVSSRRNDFRQETTYICRCPAGKQCRQEARWGFNGVTGWCVSQT